MRFIKFFAHFADFIQDAGDWGLTSALAALVSLGFSLYASAKGSIAVYPLLLASVLLLWIGAYVAWNKIHDEVLELRQKASEVPRIKQVKDSYKCDVRNWKIGHEGKATSEQICSLVASFINAPESHCDSANAKQVIAKLEFFNIDVEQNPRRLFEVQGRWATNLEPERLSLQQTNRDILATDIRIGETVELDIAFRYLHENEAFAISNESRPQVSRNPKLQLVGKAFLVKVRLVAAHVDEKFEFRFENSGKWDHLKSLN